MSTTTITILMVAASWAVVTVALGQLHRRGRWPGDHHRDLLAVGALGGLTLGFFWRPLLAQDVWLPADGGDLVSFLYPLYRFAASELQAGRIPLWNPHLYGGAPFIGDIQAGIFYPINLVLSLLGPADFPYTRMQWLSALHFFIAGVNMYVCLRWLPGTPTTDEERPPLRRLAALAGAVAFMFSDLFITHFGNLNMVAVFAWLPLVFGLFYRAAVLDRTAWALGAGLVLGLATLAGHLQMTLFIALALGFVTAYFVLRRAAEAPGAPRTRKPLLHLLLCGAVAVGISAPILGPALELARHSARAAWGYTQTVEYSLAPPQLIGLAIPQWFGRGPALHWGLWPRVEVGYLGILPLVLVAAAWLFRRDALTGLFTGLSLLALLLALGIYSILHGWLSGLVPGFAQLRASARFVGVMDFGLAALAAVGLDALLAVPPWEQPMPLVRLQNGLRKAVTGVWLIPIPLTYLALLLGQDKDPQIVLRISVTLIGGVVFALLLTASWGWLAAFRARWFSATWAGLLAVALIFLDLASTGAYTDLGDADPSARFSAHPTLIQFLKQDGEIFRIDTRTGIAQWWQPNTALMYGLQDVGGVVNPLELEACRQFWERLDGRASRVYDLLNVKYIFAPRDAPLDEEAFELAFDGDPDLLVYRNRDALPRAFLVPRALSVGHDAAWAHIQQPDFKPTEVIYVEGGPALEGGTDRPGTAQIISYATNGMELSVQATAQSYLFLSEVFYPGWQATLDGEPTAIYRANGIFRAVLVPPGEHRIALHYAPGSWRAGVAVGGLTWAALAAGGLIGLRRGRSAEATR